MDFLISDTFTASLARLTADAQKAVKTTAFDLQLNPANPGMQFHRLERAKDPNFWSVRVNRDIRIIVRKTDVSLLLCYVHHHDAAYQWAERRKLERHRTSGAMQLVEVRETVREVTVPRYGDATISASTQSAGRRPFAVISDDGLLSYGVPSEWLGDVRDVEEDRLFDVLAHLPSEAAEALLELATGGTPRQRPTQPPTEAGFEHPDAKRHFAVMTTAEQLERALASPWNTWAVFLHPDQRDLVERRFSGPARVAGYAGTGKTIVALHRAVYLTRAQPRARVALTTFNHTLADALKAKLDQLVGNEPAIRDRITVDVVDHVALQAWEGMTGRTVVVADDELMARLIGEASVAVQPHPRWWTNGRARAGDAR